MASTSSNIYGRVLRFYAEFGLPLHIRPTEVRGRAKQCYAIFFSIINTYLMNTFASENILSRLMLGLTKSSIFLLYKPFDLCKPSAHSTWTWPTRACNTILNHQIKIMPHLDNSSFVIRSNCRVRSIWAKGTGVRVSKIQEKEGMIYGRWKRCDAIESSRATYITSLSFCSKIIFAVLLHNVHTHYRWGVSAVSILQNVDEN